jgi:uncharacterized protein
VSRLVRGAAVIFLIDGYNLMHAVGLARKGLPAGALARARTEFLDWLAGAAEKRGTTMRVIFDAPCATSGSPESDHRGVLVRFACGRTADDEIEELLAAERRPAGLTVVSNDSRLREAARRRGSAFQSCEEFIDWSLETGQEPRKPRRVAEPEKPEPVAGEADNAALLEVFSRPLPKRRRR